MVQEWQKFSFGTLPWRANPAETKRILESRGYIYSGTAFDGGLAFSGSLDGRKASVFPDFTNAKELNGIAIVVDCGNVDSAGETYDRIRNDLIRKYGPPWLAVRNYLNGYEEGGDREADGLRTGSIIIASSWKNDTDEGDEAVKLEINRQLHVQIHYDFEDWSSVDDEGDL